MKVLADNFDRLPQRQLRAVAETDDMPPELRGCVHEFGYAIVKAFVSAGVTSPGQIRRLVQECWQGARNPHQGKEGRKSPVLEHLDWLLIQSGSKITARTLLRVLWQNGQVIMPREPSALMVDASIATVSTHTEVMTKQRKHLLRLREAITAGAKSMWPHLFDPDGAA